MNIFRIKSIHQRFVLGLAIVITVTLLIFSATFIFYNARSTEKDLQRQMDRFLTLSIQSLSSALWQYSHEYVNDYIDSLFLYEDVVFARVATETQIFKTKTRDGYQNFDFSIAVDPARFVARENDVMYNNVNVGKITIVMSKERIRQQIIYSSLTAISLLLLIIAAISITIYQLFRRYIFNPLINIGNSARLIAGGNLDAQIDTASEDEIGQLAHTFNQMMQSIKAITASRDELNHEITERKQAEEALRAVSQLNESIVGSSPIGISIYNSAGNCVAANDAAAEVTGATKAQVLQQNYHQIDSWKKSGLYDVALCSMQEKAKKRHEIHVKTTFEKVYTLDIHLVPISIENEPHLLVMLDDITVRKLIEEKIARFGRIFEDSLNEIYLFNADTLKFIQVNSAAQHNLGYTMEEFQKLTPLDLNPEFTSESFAKLVAPLRKGERGKIVFETVYKRKDQSLYDVEVHLQLLKYEHKALFAAIILDITERKLAEEERKKLQEQLLQSQKMEAIGSLAGGIAHEFNNILGTIIGNTELAINDVPESNPARECLEEIQSASLRAKDVVRQILGFARKSVFQLVPLQISPIISETLELIRASIPTTIEIRRNLSCKSDTVMADPTQISQVLMNLCINAKDAMQEKGGVLEVKLENTSIDEKSAIRYEGLGPGNYVKMTVRDTGHGIDPKNIDRIFDPYFTTTSLAEGPGMGLAVVHGIVKHHKGAIRVESELGKGTVFEVLFPLTEAEEEQKTEKSEVLPAGAERILFVDDEKALVKMAKRMLEMQGYQVEAKSDSVEALELFRSKPDRFDLIITDMTMPKMTGDKLAKEILSIRPDMPIILCSGFSEKIDAEKAKELGIRKYIEKPLNMSDFVVALRKVLDAENEK